MMGQDEAQRPNDVRRHAQQSFPLPQGMTHHQELVIFEISKPAVNELRRGGRRRGRQIAFFRQQHGQAAAGCIARDTSTVHSTSNDCNIVQGALGVLRREYASLESGPSR